MNPIRAERRAKALGLTLVGSMFVVALVVYSWPAGRAPLLSAAIPMPLVRLMPVSDGFVPIAPKPVLEPAPPVAVAAPRDVAMPAAPQPSMLDAHPIVARVPAVVVGDAPAAVRTPIVIDAAPLVAIAALPDANGQPITVADADAPWDAMAHAGIALGRAFRNAGVKTAAAFVRVF